MSYYGPSKFSENEVKYSGPLKEIPLEGNGMADVIHNLLEKLPSAHLLIVPQLGLLITVKSDDEYFALHFKSSMSTSAAADLMATLIQAGRKLNMLDEYGAYEFL